MRKAESKTQKTWQISLKGLFSGQKKLIFFLIDVADYEYQCEKIVCGH